MPSTDPAARYRVLRIIAIAFAISLLIYGTVGELFVRGLIGPPPIPIPAADLVRWVLIGIAVVLLAVSRRVRGQVVASRGADVAAHAQATVTALAMAEAPAVIGFAWVIITRRATDFYVLLVLSAIGLALNWPKRADFEEAARRRR